MTVRLPTQLTTSTGAKLPLPALPQDKLLAVNIEQIPLIKDVFPGIHIQPLRLAPERGEWVFMAIVEPGRSLDLGRQAANHGCRTHRSGTARRIMTSI
ncbi:hypothetical protein [Cupriavidus sp. 8B]